MSFREFGLSDPLLRALEKQGYESPTPIQSQAIPPVLAERDVLGCAQTGTGKTAAFALPILHNLMANPIAPSGGQARPIRVLVMAPTRELAVQIAESFAAYGQFLPIRHTVVFGGVKQGKQVSALKQGVDILIATPGRLLDLINQRHIRLSDVNVLVLDEADRMLDMGFLPDIYRVIKLLPAQRQTLLFSATMPKEIMHLAQGLLNDPVSVSVTPPATTAETVEQSVYLVEKENKLGLLIHLLNQPVYSRVLVFARTKHGAEKLSKNLNHSKIPSDAIHGNKSQNARQHALARFKQGASRVLVASDIASRGLDIDEVSHVINYDLPNEPETYVHRIGRTGRAGARGKAISFCSTEEKGYLRAVEKTAAVSIPVIEEQPFHAAFEKLAMGAPDPSGSRAKPYKSNQRPTGRRAGFDGPRGNGGGRNNAGGPRNRFRHGGQNTGASERRPEAAHGDRARSNTRDAGGRDTRAPGAAPARFDRGTQPGNQNPGRRFERPAPLPANASHAPAEGGGRFDGGARAVGRGPGGASDGNRAPFRTGKKKRQFRGQSDSAPKSKTNSWGRG